MLARFVALSAFSILLWPRTVVGLTNSASSAATLNQPEISALHLTEASLNFSTQNEIRCVNNADSGLGSRMRKEDCRMAVEAFFEEIKNHRHDLQYFYGPDTTPHGQLPLVKTPLKWITSKYKSLKLR